MASEYKTDHSRFDNSSFSKGKPPYLIALWMMVNSVVYNNSLSPFSRIKTTILRIFGAKIGTSVVLKPRISIKYPWRLSIGDHTWIGENVWIDNLVQVSIGNNVCISQGAMLLTGNHNYKKSSFDLMTGEIILEDGVWIGAKAIVCPGVKCGTHSILTVGSVATKDLEPYGIYQGNPAVLVRKRDITS